MSTPNAPAAADVAPGSASLLRGRHAIVTGASRGVGRGIAVGLGEAGATVFVTGRSTADLEETARRVREAGGVCVPHICDHEDDEDVSRFFRKVETYLETSAGGVPLDLLVNNAFGGGSQVANSRNVPLWYKSGANPSVPDPNSYPGTHWDKINNVGLRSNYVAAVHALRLMIPRKTGLVLNISSIGGVMSLFDPAYSTGKCANDRMVAEIAKALYEPVDTGVRMFTLYPGIVSTEIMLKAIEEATASQGSSTDAPGTDDTEQAALRRFMWNAESPTYVGRVIAAIAADENKLTSTRRNGGIVIVTEAGNRYKIRDTDGEPRYSFRSLRTLAWGAVPWIRSSMLRFLVPDVFVPWFILKLVVGADPRIAR